MTLRFGWMKFSQKKNAIAYPGFVHPPDKDGIPRAVTVTKPGYTTNVKNVFFDYKENIPEVEKGYLQRAALKELNANFGFSFV